MGKIYEALQQAAAKSQPKGETSEEKGLLLVKLAEIKEISDKLFEQIEKKIEVMKTLEASVDEKIEVMKTLEASVDEKIVALQDERTLLQEPQASKNLPKIVTRKWLWATASLVLGLVIIYFVFLQKNNAPLTPLYVEQPNNAQKKENSDVGKTTATDLIREKYNAQLDTQTGKQVSQPVQREARKIETTAAKEIKQKGLKRTITVVTKSATIRANPSLDSQPVSWVSQGIIFVIQDEVVDEDGKKWYKVVTSEGKEGWLADKVVRELS